MTPGRATYGETTMPEENKGFLSVEEVAGNTGEIHSLKPNNNSTIQPIALLRLGVFVPTLKSPMWHYVADRQLYKHNERNRRTIKPQNC